MILLIFSFLQVGYVSSLEGTLFSIGRKKVIVSPYGKISYMFFVIFSYHVCVCAEKKHARRRKNAPKNKKNTSIWWRTSEKKFRTWTYQVVLAGNLNLCHQVRRFIMWSTWTYDIPRHKLFKVPTVEDRVSLTKSTDNFGRPNDLPPRKTSGSPQPLRQEASTTIGVDALMVADVLNFVGPTKKHPCWRGKNYFQSASTRYIFGSSRLKWFLIMIWTKTLITTEQTKTLECRFVNYMMTWMILNDGVIQMFISASHHIGRCCW